MFRNKFPSPLAHVLFLTSLSLMLANSSFAQATEKVLGTFTFHEDGGFPMAGVTVDAKGNLFGVGSFGGFIPGSICCGTVFELSPGKSGGWTKRFYDFRGPVIDAGAYPMDDRLTVTPNGTILGTTYVGGDLTDYCPQEVFGLGGCGTVFAITP